MTTRATRALLLALLFATHAVAADFNTWRFTGPGGGNFHDIVESYDTTGVFAAYGTTLQLTFSDVGTQAGQNWSLLYDFGDVITDLEVDPLSPGHVYAAVENKGLFRSDDRGHTFTLVTAASFFAQVVAVAAGNDGQTIYYSLSDGRFFTSPDRGVTLTQRASTGIGLSHIFVDRSDPNVLYAAHGTDVWRSANGGAAWQSSQVDASAPSVFEVLKAPANVVAATTNGLYTSGDGGVSWMLRQAGRFLSVRADRSAAQKLVAVDNATGILYVSSDSGATWSAFGNPLYGFPQKAIYFFGNIFFIASQQGVQHNDAQPDWTFALTGPNASAPFSMSEAGHSFTLNDGSGLFDPAGQRIDLAPAFAFVGALRSDRASLAVRPDNPQALFLGVFDKGVLRSIDGGTSWIGLGTGLANFAIDRLGFDPANPSTMFASVSTSIATPAQGLYWSTDGGATWAPRSTNLAPVQATSIAVDPSDSTRMYLTAAQILAPSGTGGLYRSLDAGRHWTQSLSGTDVRAIAIDPTNSNRLYLATWNGLLVSNDGGDTFTANAGYAAITNQAVAGIFLDPLIPSTVYAAGFITGITPSQPKPNAGSVVLRSVDSGQTWETLRSASDKPYFTISHFLPGVRVNTGGFGVALFTPAPDLRINVRFDTQPLGGTGRASIEVSNAGPFAATGVRWVTTLPSGIANPQLTTPAGVDCSKTGLTLTCTKPVVRVNETVSVDITYPIPESWDTQVAIVLSATVTSREPDDADPSNNTGTWAGGVVDGSRLETPLQSSVNSTTVGQAVTFSTTVTNVGTSRANDAAIAFNPGPLFTLASMPTSCRHGGDNIAFCELAPLPAGSSAGTFSFTAIANGTGDADPTIIIYTPSFAGGKPNDSVRVSIVSGGDLSVALTDSADPVQTSTLVTYRATVQNNSNVDLPDVVLDVAWPAGSVVPTAPSQGSCTTNSAGIRCNLGTVAKSSSIDVTLSATSAAAGTVAMTATVSTSASDPSPANNSASQSTTYNSPPNPGGGGGSSGGGSSNSGGGGAMDFGSLTLGLLLAMYRAATARRSVRVRKLQHLPCNVPRGRNR